MCNWQENRGPEVADKFCNEGKDFPTVRFLTEFLIGFWDLSTLLLWVGYMYCLKIPTMAHI